MRDNKYLDAAFRKPDREIVIETEELGKIYQRPLKKIPFLRGLIILWDALGLSTKYLTKSANHQSEEEDEKIEGSGKKAICCCFGALSLQLAY